MTQYDVVGIGSAIVDVLAHTEDAFLSKHDLKKGSMQLIDQAQAERLYAAMGQATECSGGSAANTLAGIASLGGRAAFIGKVADDQLGEIFAHDMCSIGVHFASTPSRGDVATARCFVFVTPDAQRTMNTFLGAASLIADADMDAALIAASSVLYIEGYLWDAPHAITAIQKAITLAKTAGRKVAFTLSDGFCVDRHRDAFLQLIEKDLDILFANEVEITALYKTNSFDEAISRLQQSGLLAAITRSEKGCAVVQGARVEIITAETVDNVVDTTGAGDLYAAGFLYAYTRGLDLPACGKLGNQCAAQIIAQLGARSQQPLKKLVA